jgi:uncharacterized protein YecT (DUF1311 family)
LNKVFAKVEGELNSTYQEVLKRKGPVVKKLRIAQRSWLAYRAANCDAEAAEYEGGSIAPQIYGLCRIRMTRARIKEIRDGFIQEH